MSELTAQSEEVPLKPGVPLSFYSAYHMLA